jgi:hypothetical protein
VILQLFEYPRTLKIKSLNSGLNIKEKHPNARKISKKFAEGKVLRKKNVGMFLFCRAKKCSGKNYLKVYIQVYLAKSVRASL